MLSYNAAKIDLFCTCLSACKVLKINIEILILAFDIRWNEDLELINYYPFSICLVI